MIGSIFPGFHRGDEKMARIAGRNRMDAAEPSPTDRIFCSLRSLFATKMTIPGRPHRTPVQASAHGQNHYRYAGPSAYVATEAAIPGQNHYAGPTAHVADSGRSPRPKPLF